MRIDSEFKNLIPPLTDEEYKGLEESIISEGCRDALVLWDDILIDGHNRYEICTRHNIPFETIQMDFDTRNDALVWMIKNQFGRRNLPIHERARLALRLKPVIAAKAKENQLSTLKQNSTVSQKSVERIDTQKELAKAAGVSHDTIAKVEKIENEAPEPVVQASRRGEISVNTAYQVTKLEPEQQEEIARRFEHIDDEPEETRTPKKIVKEVISKPHVSFNSGNNEWYTPSNIIEAARTAMGTIDIDPASSDIANQTVKASTYYTIETNGLDKTWSGNVWMNPPYSAELIGKFADKLCEEKRNYKQAVVLVNNATETEWFSKIISIASVVCFPCHRVKFYKPDGETGSPLQGQAIVYIGDNKQSFINAFTPFGWFGEVYGVQR